MKSKKGFTLVELLAVIAILAILVILALPNVINMFNQARKQTFVIEAKKIYTEAGKKFVSSSISGKSVKVINSEDDSKLDMTGKKLQYCIILDNSGKVTSMKVSNGEWIASLDGNKQIEDLTTDDLTDGNLDGYNCSNNTPTIPEPLNCTFDGELKQGAKYVNGQYTYSYKQETRGSGWLKIEKDGWGVTLTDKTSTSPITSKLCTYINNKPIVSMSYMFTGSAATSIDLSSFDTSNVINMSLMFADSSATSLDLSSFDTSKVTDMSYMLYNIEASNIDLSGFNTSNVINMGSMFAHTKAINLDLSSFDTSKVFDMSGMFANSKVINLNLGSFNTKNVTNMSSMFSGTELSSLNISSFDTSNVTNMEQLFWNSGQLKTIYTSNKFIISSVKKDTEMFKGCSNLIGGAGTKYSDDNIGKEYARIDGGTSNPGYFTLKK